MSPDYAVQAALRDLIAAALPTLPVHDAVPTGTPSPYVAFDETAAEAVDDVGSCGRVYLIRQRILIVVASASREQALAQCHTVRLAVDDAQPALAGGHRLIGPLRFRRSGSGRFRVAALIAAYVDVEALVQIA